MVCAMIWVLAQATRTGGACRNMHVVAAHAAVARKVQPPQGTLALG